MPAKYLTIFFVENHCNAHFSELCGVFFLMLSYRSSLLIALGFHIVSLAALASAWNCSLIVHIILVNIIRR